MKRSAPAILVIGLLCVRFVVGASATSAAEQASTGSCVLIQERDSEQSLFERGDCAARLSPASTFKIPHALVALETGVVTTTSVERWDGVTHEQQAEWNH